MPESPDEALRALREPAGYRCIELVHDARIEFRKVPGSERPGTQTGLAV